jgi:hypothetical protein
VNKKNNKYHKQAKTLYSSVFHAISPEVLASVGFKGNLLFAVRQFLFIYYPHLLSTITE